MIYRSYKFREIVPKRTCTKSYSDYRRYKSVIASDFNNRCAYTDSPDYFFGGKRCFHIDHIKPKIKYPELENDYNNLAYVCSYVNIKKSDIEFAIPDPCLVDWNNIFYRDHYGNIKAIKENEYSESLYISLSLYLKRYGIVFLLEKLKKQKKELHNLCKKLGGYKNADKDLLVLMAELDNLYMEYSSYLEAEL
ncbi:HNH endonuclease [Proteus mirabilis]|uniref:HNH endonuclease n=1 Tax=Proteus mirabilis TaxID=584 RepID=UPI003FD79693